ncbi:MAG TPA: TldD/PmbA family protein, partial [Dehalococcoidia bacterium]|nr:TldD/PmbA family protein [Dehalococcoidia bacterium]
MPQKVSIDVIPEIRAAVADIVSSYVKGKADCHYADIRLEVDEGKVAVAENGMDKFSGEDYGFSLGIRVIAGARAPAAGYVGQMLGAADLSRLSHILHYNLDRACERALANAAAKAVAREQFGPLAGALYDLALAPVEVRQDSVGPQFQVDPRQVTLSEASRYVQEVSQQVQGLSKEVVFNYISATTGIERILFVSSEGANLDQTWAVTQGTCFVVAQGKDGHQELYDFSGHLRGWEVITKGVDQPDMKLPNLLDFSLALARDTIELAKAPPCKATDKEVVVVTDPHYNALVCHEVVGHPSELDRALKFETGYAGRSWLLKDLHDNQIGQRVGSDLVTAFSDPTLDGFGRYHYDDEGTPARRVYHIRKGIYEEFANSRQTAAILDVPPNGHFKATDASLVPLIRMSNTVFAPGDRDPQDIIREVDRGYYVSGHRIPSVAESRENFRITSMKVQEIR